MRRMFSKPIFAVKTSGVILAHDGKAGLEAALTQHPALILLDIMLPGMTGTEILSGCAANPMFP